MCKVKGVVKKENLFLKTNGWMRNCRINFYYLHYFLKFII